MQVADSRMTASVGSRTAGSGRSSTRTSPGAYMTTPRMELLPAAGRSVEPGYVVRAFVGSSQPARGSSRESLSRGVPTGHLTSRGSRRNVGRVDNRAEVREFLSSRRAKITPQQAGVPDIGTRRVEGLRRGEVAALAGVSVEYYSKLERGAIAGVSASVLDAIARALQLDDAERAHLFHLAHAADGTSAGMRPRRRPGKRWIPRPSLQWVLARYTSPAIVRNGRMDLLATNHLGRAMHTSVYDDVAGGQPNFARFTFLSLDAAHNFYRDWDGAADTCVAI